MTGEQIRQRAGAVKLAGRSTGPEVLKLIVDRDHLKAEVEDLRFVLQKIMTQVDGNIRPTVRDCANGRNDVQDIYGYCDAIERLFDAAMSKVAS